MVANAWIEDLGGEVAGYIQTNQDYYANGPCTTSPINGSQRCSRDAHYFDCKHERFCQCKQTSRLPLELEKGL